jgi:hypothetical protein
MRSTHSLGAEAVASPALLAAGSGRIWLLPLIPAFAIAALWWPALWASFQFDDWNVIVDEPRVHSLAAWWQSMPGIRPLLKLSYALNFAMSPEPLGFRLFNVLVHALSAGLVFSLLRVRAVRAGLTASHAMQAALLAALIFALHPVQTEAVTYISGRSSSLAACFSLMGLWCWVQSEERASTGSRAASAWLIGCCVAFVAAVASKETALVLPLALWLYSADRPVRTTLSRLAPVALLALAMLLIAAALPTYRHLLTVSLETRSIGENLLTQSHALLYLAAQLIRIWNGNADPQLVAIPGFATALLCAAWAIALIGALTHVRRWPIGAFAILWFLLWLAPTNSLLPRLDFANDRQLYLAMVGPVWWLAVRATGWTQTLSRKRLRDALVSIAAIAVVATLSLATLERNRAYETEVTFWEHTVARNPSSARAANNLGMAYAIACRPDEAATEFRRAVSMDGSDFRARINLALLLRGQLPGIDPSRCARRQGTL